MVDTFSTKKRSQIMANIKGKDTKPEIIIRSLLHKMGYRFRLHRRDLPGNPDIVLPKHKKIISVHGCFWHGHKNCQRAKRPTSNKEFWNQKLSKNIDRDRRNQKKLKGLGWKHLVIWQCQITKSSEEGLVSILSAFLKTKNIKSHKRT